jgi:hypothetical protein
MCDKCEGLGLVFNVERGWDWYGTGGYDTENVVEAYCDCEAGDWQKVESLEAEVSRDREYLARQLEAVNAGEEFIPF